jgi:hypothetical protein
MCFPAQPGERIPLSDPLVDGRFHARHTLVAGIVFDDAVDWHSFSSINGTSRGLPVACLRSPIVAEKDGHELPLDLRNQPLSDKL